MLLTCRTKFCHSMMAGQTIAHYKLLVVTRLCVSFSAIQLSPRKGVVICAISYSSDHSKNDAKTQTRVSQDLFFPDTAGTWILLLI